MKNIYIDTTNNKEIIIKLTVNGKEEIIKSLESRSIKILPLIANSLKKYNVSINEIDSVDVNLGPGSFTGIRVGVAIANALGESLRIPINGKIGKLVEPKYT